MSLNPFFLNGTRNEQGLVQDLINELIRMGGQNVIYLPRKIINEKQIIKEILVSKFDSGFSIEAYVLNYDGFGGQGDILTKFGVRTSDSITFVISKERYEQSIIPFIKNSENIKLISRPQEGDLIYFPIDNALFEIKYVEVKSPFYQLNNLYTYQLKCEIFEYEDELIDTGIQDVDHSVKDFGYIQTLYMIPQNTQNAQVTVGLATNNSSSKSVQYIDIINGGFGFKSAPTVRIDNPSEGGEQAKAIATLKKIGNDSTIDKILIQDPGHGYDNSPNVKIISNSGTGFIGTCVINTGVLGKVNIINGGNSYSSAPIVSISTSPSGQNSSAISLLTSAGVVTSILYNNAGAGYTQSPTIQIGQSVGISTGSYIFNELVQGQTTETKAYVKEWDINTRKLKVSIIDGGFSEGEVIIGQNASYKVFKVNTDDEYDPYASNVEIETDADDILDFSERNPFGDF